MNDPERQPNPYPTLPAQRCRGRVLAIREPDEVIGEILVLPNLIVWFNIINGAMVGESRVCSPQIAGMYADEHLPALVEHVNTCEGEACGHAGHLMEQVGCDAW
jgi:hypothetical protein